MILLSFWMSVLLSSLQEQFWRISMELEPEKLREISCAIDKDSPAEFPEITVSYNIPSVTARQKKPKKKRSKWYYWLASLGIC